VVSVSCSTLRVRGGGGVSTVADRQRKNAFIRRSVRCGFVPADLPMSHSSSTTAVVEELFRLGDETLLFLTLLF